MKKIMIVITVFLSIMLQAQTGLVTYTKSMYGQLDNKNYSTVMNPSNQIGSDSFFYLSFNKYESIFSSENELENDANNGYNSNRKEVFYVNLKTKESLHQKEWLGDVFLINQKRSYNWELTKESKKIGDYLCYKATVLNIKSNLKKRITVWYTPKISASFGPIGLKGLPGLILEYTETTTKGNNILITKFAATKIMLNTDVKIKKPQRGIKVTSQEFDNLRRKALSELRKKYRRN